MYVCLCNSFTCADVRRACGAGAATPADVYRHMGCKPQCGKCRDLIVDLMAPAKRDASGRDRPAPVRKAA